MTMNKSTSPGLNLAEPTAWSLYLSLQYNYASYLNKLEWDIRIATFTEMKMICGLKIVVDRTHPCMNKLDTDQWTSTVDLQLL